MRSKLMFSLMLLGMCWFLLAAVTVFPNFAWAQNQAPFVSNVHAEQRTDTGLVDITYDVEDAGKRCWR